MSFLKENYGLEDMSLEREMSLPLPEKQTRAYKISIVDIARNIADTARVIEERGRTIPCRDDADHAELVRKHLLLLCDASNALMKAYYCG